MMESWHSYPSIYNLGHKAIENLLGVPVNVEEKVDGSQFSFGVDYAGELRARSKGKQLVLDAPEKLFERAVEVIQDLAPLLHRGWTYRGEYLAKPKHNSLAYERTPKNHIIIFDINTNHECYLDYEFKRAEAERIGLECVPLLATGTLSLAQLREIMDRDSILGGQKIEGVVIKPVGYGIFGPDKKVLMGKFVSEAFKEKHAHEWKQSNPGAGDIIELLGEQYRAEGRWQKAIQHLTEAGKLEGDPRDIGALLKEIPADIEKECADEIKDALWKWAWPKIRRKATAGFPEWYKDQLLQKQFAHESQSAA